MPIQRSVTIRDGLMEEIGRVKSLPPCNANRKTLNEQLEKIEKELQSRRNMFPVGNHWDELVIQEFDALEQDVADDKVDGYNPEEMEFKIHRMNENLERLKKILDVSADFYSHSQSSTASTSKHKHQQKQQQQNQQPTTNHWQKNIEKNILESGAMTQLQCSYHNLKDRLKLCLLCFSVFPINSEIKKRPLIYWWIGEGFVTQANPKTAEMVGEDVLEELQEKGMIKPWRKPGAPWVSSYTMHPWIHRMVISVARTAGFFDFDDNGKVTSNTGHRSRRVCFVSESRRDQAADSHNNSFTMFNVNEPYLDIELNWFSRQERVRVLQFGRWQNSVTHHIEVVNTKFLLEGLGAQKHLQYLSLRGLSRITELPETVTKLTAVRILDLRACHNLEKLPSGIKAMKMLTHLDVSECYLLEQMPKGLDGLSHLQVLKGFVIGRSNDPCRLRDFPMLKTLRKLSMIVGRDASIAEDELEHFPKLQILTITWGATEFTSSLKLPRELEKLDLRCFPESDPPTSWLKPSVLMNLKRLYISGGKLANLRKEETESWKVEILRLKFLKDLEMEWSSLQRDFPDLLYLQKKQCDKLDFTECDGNGVWERALLNPSSPPTTILPKDIMQGERSIAHNTHNTNSTMYSAT